MLSRVLRKVSDEFYREFRGEKQRLYRSAAKAGGNLVASAALDLFADLADMVTASPTEPSGSASAEHATSEKSSFTPDFEVAVSHRHSQDEALRRVKQAIGNAKREFSGYAADFRESWNGNIGTFTATIKGKQLFGHIVVTGRDVKASGTIPSIPLVPRSIIKEKVERVLREKLVEILR